MSMYKYELCGMVELFFLVSSNLKIVMCLARLLSLMLLCYKLHFSDDILIKQLCKYMQINQSLELVLCKCPHLLEHFTICVAPKPYFTHYYTVVRNALLNLRVFRTNWTKPYKSNLLQLSKNTHPVRLLMSQFRQILEVFM